MDVVNVSFKCPECGQQVEDGVIEMLFELRDTHVTVRNGLPMYVLAVGRNS